jgi:undecaprenyl-diphosphatase
MFPILSSENNVWGSLLHWDRQTLITLNNLGTEQYDRFWLIVTNFFTWIPLFLWIVYLVAKYRKQFHYTGVLATFLGMGTLVTVLILFVKNWVERHRPVNDPNVSEFLRVIIRPSDFSFFSGHAASSFSIATLAFLLLYKRHKWSFVFFLWPLLFSYSRLYLGVHYPSDILIGALVGTGLAIMAYRLYKRFFKLPDLL